MKKSSGDKGKPKPSTVSSVIIANLRQALSDSEFQELTGAIGEANLPRFWAVVTSAPFSGKWLSGNESQAQESRSNLGKISRFSKRIVPAMGSLPPYVVAHLENLAHRNSDSISIGVAVSDSLPRPPYEGWLRDLQGQLEKLDRAIEDFLAANRARGKGAPPNVGFALATAEIARLVESNGHKLTVYDTGPFVRAVQIAIELMAPGTQRDPAVHSVRRFLQSRRRSDVM